MNAETVSRHLLLVGAGCFLGSALRYLVAVMIPFASTGFPFATFAVNVTGCFLIGVLSWSALSLSSLSPEARLFLMTDVCGGFLAFYLGSAAAKLFS